MRICPKCKTPYPDTTLTCARDGLSLTTLVELIEDQEPIKLSRDLHGYVVGNYRIEKRLGVGGMGAVYQAAHLSIGKEVAVKILREANAQNPEYLERFYQEARSIAKIGHENVIQILDFGCTDEGLIFLVMELLQGRSLEDLLLAGMPPLTQTLQICTQICDALEAAHQQQIVHRDLKPENIFLISSRGDPNFVKVLDFGIAKQLTAEANKGLTVARQLVGTPLYMAPEQSTAADTRSDIYSLGVILYRMLTGQLPFDGETVIDILYKHLATPPTPPSQLNPSIPKELEAIVLKALAKNKEDRFPSMAAFRDALQSLQPHAPIGAVVQVQPIAPKGDVEPSKPNRTTLSGSLGELSPTPQKRSMGVVIGAFLSVIIGVGGALILLPSQQEAPAPIQPAAQPTANQAEPVKPSPEPASTPAQPTSEAAKPEPTKAEDPKVETPKADTKKQPAKVVDTKKKPNDKEKKTGSQTAVPGSTEL